MSIRHWFSSFGRKELSAREMKERAVKLAAEQRCAQAAELYRRLTELEPAEPTHWIRLGDLYTRLNLAVDAAEAYVQAVTLLARRREHGKAVALCRIALEQQPGHMRAASLLEDAQLQMAGSRIAEGVRRLQSSPPQAPQAGVALQK